MTAAPANLFDAVPASGAEEQFLPLVAAGAVLVERIVSTGQASPPGFWYDQARDEFVLLLQGSAGLTLEGEAAPRRLAPGDWLHLPAHRRHRVDWTSAAPPAIWLAVHFPAGA